MWFILFPRLALVIFDHVWKNGNIGLENLEVREFLSKQYVATLIKKIVSCSFFLRHDTNINRGYFILHNLF